MTGYPYRTLAGWLTALCLAWLGLCSPWSATWNLLLGMFVVALMLAAMIVATRRGRARRRASRAVLEAVNASLDALPGEMRRNTPLVLAVGEPDGALASAFGDALVRITESAIWVRVDDPARLAHVADALKRWRDGQGPDAVACLAAAGQIRDAATLNARLGRLRHAIGEASRAVDYPLPVCVAVYGEASDGPPDECPWFGMSGEAALADEAWIAQVAASLDSYARTAGPADRAARWYRAARLHALARWVQAALLPPMRDESREGSRDGRRTGRPVQVAAVGVIAVRGTPADKSLFAGAVAHITGLVGAHRAQGSGGVRYPLPEPLILGIGRQPVRRALPRALAHGFVWLAVAFCAAAAASAWQNRALVARVTGNMDRYRALAPEQDAARVDALKTVRRDRDELDRHARNGVPLRLGLGLYRGAALRAPIDTLIASYRPPPPPPVTIELDSLALFRSGSATLNPGSNRVMIGALEMVRAHPDKRVLVAGHTDATGNSHSNLRLSEARAVSVRNWLADAAGLPLTHFATQGYGDTRPKADNDTEAGRAANRRVEITLVPDCRDGDRVTSGQSACSFQQKE
ncbi:OmpA family protein [Cupriavidus sp. 2KB_3]|uniref:OmpA family protein n=1 Tax=Cupriavidus TaxID=106589 RepID=UPI0011ECBA52|nr:OmpA family protein [Cupriavidus campinensis]